MMMNPTSAAANRIEELREGKFTVRQLANATGLSVGYLSELQRGERAEIPRYVAVAVAHALGERVEVVFPKAKPARALYRFRRTARAGESLTPDPDYAALAPFEIDAATAAGVKL